MWATKCRSKIASSFDGLGEFRLGEFNNYEWKEYKFTNTYFEKVIRPTNGLDMLNLLPIIVCNAKLIRVLNVYWCILRTLRFLLDEWKLLHLLFCPSCLIFNSVFYINHTLQPTPQKEIQTCKVWRARQDNLRQHRNLTIYQVTVQVYFEQSQQNVEEDHLDSAILCLPTFGRPVNRLGNTLARKSL